MIKHFAIFIFSVAVLFTFPELCLAQQRDYMTEPEIELVRDAQDIDKRVGVLTKMIDRRFSALGIEVGGWKQNEKDQVKWGDVRTGTRSQLLSDVRQLLQKAIDDVDDVAMHNENTLTQNKTEGLLFPQAVRDLAVAATRYLTPLKTALDKTTDERDKGLILASIESCEAIIASVAQLPPPETKPSKKKGKS
jgi:hypothetical protein